MTVRLYQIRLSRLRCLAVILFIIMFVIILQLSVICRLVLFRETLFCILHVPSSAPRSQSPYPKSHKFRPGSFLKNITVGRRSFCKFRYNFFSGSAPSMNSSFSPERGVEMPYRVVYNVIESDSGGERNRITLCTHVTPEFVGHVAELLARWSGPVSIAVFVPDDDASVLCGFRRLCRCLEGMSRVSLHLVFPVRFPPKFSKCGKDELHPDGCFIRNAGRRTVRIRKNLVYPINVCRNVARVAAKTDYLLVSDVELYPSKYLEMGFIKLMAGLKEKIADVDLSRVVFVVPVFEVDERLAVPNNKRQLKQFYKEEKAVYFHKWICSHCQRFPGLERWLKQPELPDGKIEALLISRREFPFHRWEPIFIGTHSDPFYSEGLSWEGRQDKMIQMHVMCLMGYRFVILDGAFLIHSPGIKRKFDSSGIERGLRLQYERQNYLQYNKIVREASSKYGINRKCNVH